MGSAGSPWPVSCSAPVLAAVRNPRGIILWQRRETLRPRQGQQEPRVWAAEVPQQVLLPRGEAPEPGGWPRPPRFWCLSAWLGLDPSDTNSVPWAGVSLSQLCPHPCKGEERSPLPSPALPLLSTLGERENPSGRRGPPIWRGQRRGAAGRGSRPGDTPDRREQRCRRGLRATGP